MTFTEERLGVNDQRPDPVLAYAAHPVLDAMQWQGLVCVRGGKRLFGPLSASLGPGDLLWVRGANGAGKTSLLRILCGLMAASEGQIFWRGEPIAELQEVFSQQLIYLGHGAALKDDLSPLENLLFASQLCGQLFSEMEARQALTGAGLAGKEDVLVRHLSQGQRRRSALARLCAGSGVPLWILDEPFNALDKTATAWLASTLSDHLASSGIVILTTHQDVPLNGLEQRVLDL